MKNNVILLCILVFMAVKGTAQYENSKYYYYYKSEKMNLELNFDFAFVSVLGNEIENIDLFKRGSGMFKKEGLSEKMKQKLNSYDDFYWVELKLGDNISNKIYSEKIAALGQLTNTQTVSPYFTSKNCKKSV